jgi:hypothetical protein
MGVTLQSFNYINRWIKPEHKLICELGDQQFMLCPPFPENSYTKQHWTNKGLNHVYLDINGRGNCLTVNLNEDVEINQQFDFITDFGTLEHVNNYYMGFKNVHKLCKVNGLMLHILPAPGHWPNHGSWRANVKFFMKLSKLNSYKLLDCHIEPTRIGGKDSDQIYVVMQKTNDNSFIRKEDFDSLGATQEYDLEKYEIGKGRIL